MPEFSVVIPTYNEKDNITILIPAIAEALTGISYMVIVVDDQSPDGTGAAVENLARQGYPVRLLSKGKKEGIGAALRAGYFECDTPFIASTDADLSFNPKDLRRLYDSLKNGLDFVTGTRHSRHSVYEAPNRSIWVKRLVSQLGNRTLRMTTGIPLDDFSANFRAFTRAMWTEIHTRENTNSLLFEMILKAYIKGYSVGQIPVTFRDRRFGSSKLRLSWEAPKFLMKLINYLVIYGNDLARRRSR